jgi:hypothetical protein
VRTLTVAFSFSCKSRNGSCCCSSSNHAAATASLNPGILGQKDWKWTLPSYALLKHSSTSLWDSGLTWTMTVPAAGTPDGAHPSPQNHDATFHLPMVAQLQLLAWSNWATKKLLFFFQIRAIEAWVLDFFFRTGVDSKQWSISRKNLVVYSVGVYYWTSSITRNIDHSYRFLYKENAHCINKTSICQYHRHRTTTKKVLLVQQVKINHPAGYCICCLDY